MPARPAPRCPSFGPGAVAHGAPDLPHAADGDPVGQPVAATESNVRPGRHQPPPASTACRTDLAIGAATAPPVASLPMLPPSSTTTATATLGVSAGAKATNQACGAAPSACWAVPVLPATWMPGIWATCAVPLLTTCTIIAVSWSATSLLTASPSCLGSACESNERSGACTSLTR